MKLIWEMDESHSFESDVSGKSINDLNEAIWILLHTLNARKVTLKREEDLKDD